MVRSLQKKFIITAMIAVTALIVAMLVGLNIYNSISTANRLHETLDLLSRYGGERGNFRKDDQYLIPDIQDGMPSEDDEYLNYDDIYGDNDIDSEDNEYGVKGPRDEFPETSDDEFEGRKGDRRIGGRNEEDIFLTSPYFLVRFDTEGNAVFTDTSRVSSVTEDDASDLARSVYDSGSVSGRIGSYMYKMSGNAYARGTTVIFLDMSSERSFVIEIIIISLIVGVIGWFLMLALVVILSRKAIRPIAENIEKQKQFVTNAGHELKTPLAIIQANCEAMELFNGENKWSNNIKSQVSRMSLLTQNLLTLARMDESASNMVMENLDLTSIVNENIRTFAGPFRLKGVQLNHDIAEGIQYKGDRAQINQLLSLLFDNAVKYVNENGQANVSLARKDRKIVFTLTNTCAELPSSPPDRLFDRFYRSDESHSQKTGGHGIGLSVVSSIVSNHGGTVKAQYTQPDTISFIVTL